MRQTLYILIIVAACVLLTACELDFKGRKGTLESAKVDLGSGVVVEYDGG